MSFNLALVVATRNRPVELRRLLASLATQSRKPDRVVIVDSSDTPVSAVLKSVNGLAVECLRHWPPSASGQRNAGLARVSGDCDLIGFVDDDAVLEPDAIERMLEFWETAPADAAGAGFNPLNQDSRLGPRTWWITEKLGLYSRRRGAVAPSGWQSVFGCVQRDLEVDWLPSGAVVWRAEIIRGRRFDEFFDGYSYLEDVDFSYGLRPTWKLFVVAGAGYCHYPSAGGRVSARRFGRVEVRNRLYLVKKHRLSLGRCRAAVGIRLGMTLFQGLRSLDRAALERALGNLEALFSRSS
jgi:glycosyltransferase involved in cell wall biosynthesis